MSQKKNIDDLFRESISGYSAQPSGQVWQNIQDKYPAGSGNSRRWIIYSLAALLLLLGGIAGWMYYSNSSAEVIETNSIIAIEPNNSEIENGETDISEGELSIVNEESDVIENTESNEVEVVSEVKEPSPNQIAINEESKTDDSEPEIVIIQDQYSDEATVENEGVHSIYKDIAFMNTLGLQFEYQMDLSIKDPDEIKGLELFIEKKKKSHFYTGLSGMAGMMYYPSTKDQFTWSADLAFGLTAKRLYFETGIGYQEIKEQGIYSIEFRSYDSIGYYNEVQSFEVNPLNPDEIVYKTEEVSVYDSITHYTHATPTLKYSYINIPLMVGYKVYQQNKFTVGVETGVLFSIMIGKDDPNVAFDYPEYTHIKTINETPERVETNFRWQIAVRLDYRFARSMSFAIKPVFNKYLNSVYDTNKGYPDVKPYSMGLQFGLYYGF